MTQSIEFSPIQIVMEFETEKKGRKVDKESGQYAMVFGDSRYALVTANTGAKGHLIMDFNARCITTITKDKNGEIAAVKMPLMKLGNGMMKDLVQTIEETPDRKTILGYDTRKYIVKSNGNVTESWIANVDGIDWGELAEAMFSGKNRNMSSLAPSIEDMPNAIALESHTTTSGGKKVIHSYVRVLAVGDQADLSALEIPADAQVQDMTSLMKF